MSARILVVDDNPTNLKLACYLLEEGGYVVEAAVDAEHAQELLKDMTPEAEFRRMLEEMPPYQTGGDMIEFVHDDRTTWNVLPHKFEAGTPNAANAVGTHGYLCSQISIAAWLSKAHATGRTPL